MKIGFIGYGNMASAIISGALKAGVVQPQQIVILEQDTAKAKAAKDLGMEIAESVEGIANIVSVLFICVKPKDFPALLHELNIYKSVDLTFVSIAAGISIATMQKALGEKNAIMRAMPNTPLMLGAGTTALCHNSATSPKVFDFVKQVFSSAGSVYEIPENQFNHVINLNGSSPAYIYLFAQTIADYATAQGGIDGSTAMDMFADTLVGAAQMLKHSGKTSKELIDAVSSPGGTTVAALSAMQETGLVHALQAGCEACVKRADEMDK